MTRAAGHVAGCVRDNTLRERTQSVTSLVFR